MPASAVVERDGHRVGFLVGDGRAALRAVGGTQIYGRNEPGVQYAHQTINRLMKENHREGFALPKEA